MKYLHHLKTTTAACLLISLSGCASLQTAFADFKTSLKDKDSMSAELTPANLQGGDAVLKEAQTSERRTAISVNTSEPVSIQHSQIQPVQTAALTLRPASYVTTNHPLLKPAETVAQARKSSSVEPESSNYLNAIQIYPYRAGALYQVYCAPEQVTDIALQPGEELTSVSAGDTIRWIVGDTMSGSMSGNGVAGEQVHILVKPTKPGLSTNLIITTSRRTYYLELHAHKTSYMAAVSWRYPHEIVALRGAYQIKTARRRQPAMRTNNSDQSQPGLPIEALNFTYRIKGAHPDWRPLRAFDDGRKVYIQFPQSLSQSEAPPLFVTGRAHGNRKAGLVNYRIKGAYYIVDHLFKSAELRLGEKNQTVVKIVRVSKS